MRTGNRTLSLAHHGKMHSTVSKDMVVYVHYKLSVELYIFYFSNILMCVVPFSLVSSSKLMNF